MSEKCRNDVYQYKSVWIPKKLFFQTNWVLIAIRHKKKSAYLSSDDWMDNGSTVSNHENEFGVRKELVQVVGRSQGERVFVAESGGRLAVFDDYVEDERGDGVV